MCLPIHISLDPRPRPVRRSLPRLKTRIDEVGEDDPRAGKLRGYLA